MNRIQCLYNEIPPRALQFLKFTLLLSLSVLSSAFFQTHIFKGFLKIPTKLIILQHFRYKYVYATQSVFAYYLVKIPTKHSFHLINSTCTLQCVIEFAPGRIQNGDLPTEVECEERKLCSQVLIVWRWRLGFLRFTTLYPVTLIVGSNSILYANIQSYFEVYLTF